MAFMSANRNLLCHYAVNTVLALTPHLFMQPIKRRPQFQELEVALVAALLGEGGHVGVELEVHGIADHRREHHREQDHDERENEHPQVVALKTASHSLHKGHVGIETQK